MGIHDNLCCQVLRLFSLNQRYTIFLSAKKTKTSANSWQRSWKNEIIWRRSQVLISISGLFVSKKLKIEQKSNKTLVYCSKNDYFLNHIIMDVEHPK